MKVSSSNKDLHLLLPGTWGTTCLGTFYTKFLASGFSDHLGRVNLIACEV